MSDRDPVDDVLRRSTEVEIPADVEARMRRQFTEFRARLDERRRPVTEVAAALFGQRPFRWAAAAAALATVLAIVFFWGGTDGGRVYAAAVSRLAAARSVQYTMEIAPFVSVEFSHLAPAHERIKMSWGMEIRADGSDTQLVLLHATRQYVREQKGPGSLARTADLVEQLTSLPRTADSLLGERTVGGKRFVGFRVMGTRMPGAHGLASLDLWLDAASGTLDHVDLTPADAGTSGYQMHIRDIRVDAEVDPALFDMTPPAGYSEAKPAGTSARSAAEPSTDLSSSQPQVTQASRQIGHRHPHERVVPAGECRSRERRAAPGAAWHRAGGSGLRPVRVGIALGGRLSGAGRHDHRAAVRGDHLAWGARGLGRREGTLGTGFGSTLVPAAHVAWRKRLRRRRTAH